MINLAATVLRDGGIVVFPTETVYGIGAAGRLQVRRAGDLRGQGPSASTSRCPGWSRARTRSDTYGVDVPEYAHVWRTPSGRDRSRSWSRRRTASAGTSATRAVRSRCARPNHEVVRELLQAAGGPIIARAPTQRQPRAGRLRRRRGPHRPAADLSLDGGETSTGSASTVVDCTGAEPVVAREGAIPRGRRSAAWAAAERRRASGSRAALGPLRPGRRARVPGRPVAGFPRSRGAVAVQSHSDTVRRRVQRMRVHIGSRPRWLRAEGATQRATSPTGHDGHGRRNANAEDSGGLPGLRRRGRVRGRRRRGRAGVLVCGTGIGWRSRPTRSPACAPPSEDPAFAELARRAQRRQRRDAPGTVRVRRSGIRGSWTRSSARLSKADVTPGASRRSTRPPSGRRLPDRCAGTSEERKGARRGSAWHSRHDTQVHPPRIPKSPPPSPPSSPVSAAPSS